AAAGSALLASGAIVALWQTLLIGGTALAASGGVAGVASHLVPVQDDDGLWVQPAKNTSYRFVAAPSQRDGWAIRLETRSRRRTPGVAWAHAMAETGLEPTVPVTITGPAALTALRRLLPRVNHAGAPERRVQAAVRAMEDVARPADYLPHLARHLRPVLMRQQFGDSGDLTALPPEIRLAMEMAVHDELSPPVVDARLERMQRERDRA
nr:hypothetical protein [Gemmatimonadaceae bacterium]